jgi:hypothetical protein
MTLRCQQALWGHAVDYRQHGLKLTKPYPNTVPHAIQTLGSTA